MKALPLIHQPERVAPKASDVSAADWLYQHTWKKYDIFPRVLLGLSRGRKSLYNTAVYVINVFTRGGSYWTTISQNVTYISKLLKNFFYIVASPWWAYSQVTEELKEKKSRLRNKYWLWLNGFTHKRRIVIKARPHESNDSELLFMEFMRTSPLPPLRWPTTVEAKQRKRVGQRLLFASEMVGRVTVTVRHCSLENRHFSSSRCFARRVVRW